MSPIFEISSQDISMALILVLRGFSLLTSLILTFIFIFPLRDLRSPTSWTFPINIALLSYAGIPISNWIGKNSPWLINDLVGMSGELLRFCFAPIVVVDSFLAVDKLSLESWFDDSDPVWDDDEVESLPNFRYCAIVLSHSPHLYSPFSIKVTPSPSCSFGFS
jgi:hypothetical protein